MNLKAITLEQKQFSETNTNFKYLQKETIKKRFL